MTASEIRSQLAIVQAEIVVLEEHCRALEEYAAAGAIDLAGDQLREAYQRLEGAALLRNEPQAARLLQVGEPE